MTKVEAKMKNPALNSQEVTFSMVLPNQAFISNFSMEINGREYVADVMEKEEARITYNKAKNRGKGTGLVFKKNDANEFSITTNIEAGSRATFYLDVVTASASARFWAFQLGCCSFAEDSQLSS